MIADLTDTELVCEYKHGWSARGYIGHGISDRAYKCSQALLKEMKSRGIDASDLEKDWKGASHKCGEA